MERNEMKITRRNALAVLGSGLAVAPVTKAARAQAPIEWKMVTSWPKNLPGPGVTAQRLADTIGLMSGGRMKITLHAAGELVPPLQVFDAVSNGVAEIGHTASLFWAGKMPAAPIFTAAPFGLTPLEHITWIDHGGGQQLWDELYAPAGIKPYMAGNTGFQMGGWFKREINSLADIRGLKMRIPGLGGLVMQKLGAVPVTIAPGEIQAALQTGVIDATEFLGPFSDAAMGFQRVAKYYYFPGWHEPNGTGEALISQAALKALPGELQYVVEAACAAENIRALGESEWMNAETLSMLAKEGVEFREFPTDFLDAARQATGEVMAELAAKDEQTARIVASYTGAARHQAQWSQISVRSFLSARG
jgi:TRAP-type mannitol/chloroaromatic compound transport system substrate-binding protein